MTFPGLVSVNPNAAATSPHVNVAIDAPTLVDTRVLQHHALVHNADVPKAQTGSILQRVMAYALADIPVILRGPAGVGKTAIVREVAHRLGMDIVEIHLAQFEAVDLKGVPSVENGTTTWNAPTFMRPKDGKPFVLFLDELGNAEPDVVKAAYQLILDRKVGDCALPAGTIIIAASNRKVDAAFVKELPKPVNNRMAHIDFDVVSAKEWTEWALGAGVHPLVIGFIDFGRDYLHKDPAHAKGGATNATVQHAFPTPRSWEMVSRYMHTADRFYKSTYSTDIVAGIVGDAAATALGGFVRCYKDLPTWDSLLANPTVKVPALAKNSANIEVTFALAAMIYSNATIETLTQVFQILKTNLTIEYQAMVVARMRDLFARNPATMGKWATNKEVTAWLSVNKAKLV